VSLSEATRACRRCGKLVRLEDFPTGARHGGRTDGKHSWCRACKNDAHRQWVAKNAEYMADYSRQRCRREKLRVVSHYSGGGNCCACCGEYHIEFLCIDHIDGGGTKRRAIEGGGNSLYRWLHRMGYPDGYRVLCHNCNMSLGLLGYCPHQSGAGLGLIAAVAGAT